MWCVIRVTVTWADSADRHQIAHEDALHAVLHAVWVELAYEAPRPPSGVHVFHVMELREKFWARMNAGLIARKDTS
jgi:hypothetical protein